MDTVMLHGVARESSVEMTFICSCDIRINALVFRNRLFFIPLFSQINPVVNVQWIGEEMVVRVVCSHCHRGCVFRGDNGHGTFNVIN
ncbi:hypothetical protein N665_0014s0140 [Sinapis alba]|nr:hypothetical protein N665_0014s0140 [Sinapis alba]